MALEKRAACQCWHSGSAAHIVQNSRWVACQLNLVTSVSCGSEQIRVVKVRHIPWVAVQNVYDACLPVLSPAI